MARTRQSISDDVALDSQQIEILGRNLVKAALIEAGLEVATPERDNGIDLIAYRWNLGDFVARPMQIKAATPGGAVPSSVGPQTEDLHVIGVYEGTKHVNGTVEIRVNDASKPVVLALSAYQPTHWNITTGPQVRLKAVYVWGFKPGTQTVTGISQNVQIHEEKFVACAYGWEPAANKGGCWYKSLIRRIRKTTGLTETSFQGCYAGNVFEVPYER